MARTRTIGKTAEVATATLPESTQSEMAREASERESRINCYPRISQLSREDLVALGLSRKDTVAAALRRDRMAYEAEMALDWDNVVRVCEETSGD